MAEHNTEWYISSTNGESSRAIIEESSSNICRDSEDLNCLRQNINNGKSFNKHNVEDSALDYKPITQVDGACSSPSSFYSDEFSDDDYSSNEESVIGLDELRRKQTEIIMLRMAKNSSTPNHSGKKYLNSQPCPLNTPHKLAVQMLKIKKYKPSIRAYSPPVSQIDDGSAWIPEIKRTKLPIESRKEDIISTIRGSRVVVLSGSTGCGKV